MQKKNAKPSGRTIDIRDMEDDGLSADFEVRSIQDNGGNSGYSDMEVASVEMPEPSDRVKVRFEKLVQLIATHNFQEVIKLHPEEDVILSTNLLADLANAHEESTGEKKMPVILAVGVIIGVAIAYILFKL